MEKAGSKMDNIVVLDASQYQDLVQDISDINDTLIIINDSINHMHDNLAAGIQFIMYAAALYLIYRVIKGLYYLFGNTFFGGV